MKYKNDGLTRQPESLKELKELILEQLEQLEHSEIVSIQLGEGDDIHELLESIDDGMKNTKAANKVADLESKIKRLEKDLEDWQEDCGV